MCGHTASTKNNGKPKIPKISAIILLLL